MDQWRLTEQRQPPNYLWIRLGSVFGYEVAGFGDVITAWQRTDLDLSPCQTKARARAGRKRCKTQRDGLSGRAHHRNGLSGPGLCLKDAVVSPDS